MLTADQAAAALHDARRRPDAAPAFAVAERLIGEGYVAFLAGGCVRDVFLGRQPKDYDVATNATPQVVRDVFGRHRTLAVGEAFGVIMVLPTGPRTAASVTPIEVATFRADGQYTDGRRPDHVTFGDDRADALRRDFTINGLFYDVAGRRVVDHVGGVGDLGRGVLRTIGDPGLRFGEDHLRMLRAIRFATTLRFGLAESTRWAIADLADQIAGVSGERIGAEMSRVLTDDHAASGLRLLRQCRLDRVIWPSLDQINWDDAEAWLDRSAGRSLPAAIAIATAAMGLDDNQIVSLGSRWRLSTEVTRAAGFALRSLRSLTADPVPAWSRLQPILVNRDGPPAVEVAATIAPQSPTVALARDALLWPRDRLDPAPLLTGADLIAANWKPGPAMGSALRSIRQQQLDGVLTTPAEALRAVDSMSSRESGK